MNNQEIIEKLNLVPEEQFILACLRTEFSGSGNTDFPAFAYDSFDWNRVYNRSLQWRIAPLLYTIMKKRTAPLKTLKHAADQPPSLTPPTRGGEIDIGKLVQMGNSHVTSPLMGEGKGGGELIPKEFLERMKLKYFMSCVADDSMFKSLYEVLEIFHKAGIKVILFKGSHLAQFVYQDIGVRPMGDIDVLVKKGDLQKAEELLLQMGYTHPIDTKSSLHLPYLVILIK